MLRVAFVVLALSLLGLACFAQNKTEINATQPLNPQEITWDFGQVKAGEVARHVFVLKNEFRKELDIKDVSTSCGCTGSQVKKKKLLPGESTDIEVTFNSKGYLGAVKQFVYLFTDNFQEPGVPARGGTEKSTQENVSLRIDGSPIQGLDNAILRFIIKADVVK